MQHIILFENFGSSPKEIAQEIIGKMEGDGDFRGYKLSLDSTDPGVVFIIWENPQDDEQWRSSGYAEGYEEGDDKSMAIIALVKLRDGVHVNMLSSEEKYYREVVGYEDEYEDMNPRDTGVYSGYEHAKKAILDSIWKTD